MSDYPRQIRGCHDLLPQNHHVHQHVVKLAYHAAKLAGFQQVDTPLMEETRLFDRGLGESSDIVGKEMYRFTTRGGEDVSLRPEGTASIVRSYFSHGLMQATPLRYFYAGPMFRYERPQKGRLRQFHQFGAELIGVSGALADLEIIALGADILRRMGILDRVVLHINTLGSNEDRQAYRKALVEYFSRHEKTLSEDSRRRLTTNPLRILDSKSPEDRTLLDNVPQIDDFLSEESQTRFRDVCQGLDEMDIAYMRDRHLVRGLDYYEHTAFEFISASLGAQGTVLGGGCYDRLFKIVGGKEGQGVGFAAGIERLSALIEAPAMRPPDCCLIPIGDAAISATPSLAKYLRERDVSAVFGFSGKVKSRMKQADQMQARFCVIYGDEELQRHEIKLKNMQSGEENQLSVVEMAKLISQNNR